MKMIILRTIRMRLLEAVQGRDEEESRKRKVEVVGVEESKRTT